MSIIIRRLSALTSVVVDVGEVDLLPDVVGRAITSGRNSG